MRWEFESKITKEATCRHPFLLVCGTYYGVLDTFMVDSDPNSLASGPLFVGTMSGEVKLLFLNIDVSISSDQIGKYPPPHTR